MAFGDFQSLLPSESYYTKPGASMDAAKVEATKRAFYLSQMDQFYAQMAESERQFDVTSALHEKYYELDVDRFGLEEEKFDWSKEYGGRELDLRKLGIEKQHQVGMAGTRASSSAAKYGYDLGMEQLDWEKEQAGTTQKFLEDYFQKYGAQSGGGASEVIEPSGSSGIIGSPSQKTYEKEYADWLGGA